MLQCQTFIEQLNNNGLQFFTGVPDSLLSSFSAWLMDYREDNHIIAANEGNALAIGVGHYLATGNIPVIYMQNSGIGNAVNPMASLLHKDVYQIPALWIVGWRGQPNTKDEPQHVFQGKATIAMLEQLQIQVEVLSSDETEASTQISRAVSYMKETKQPFAFVVKKNTFCEYHSEKQIHTTAFPLTREEAIETILESIEKDSLIVSTTGKASRELFELRESQKENHNKDFLTVGSMGHASSIALGVARETDRKVYCIDGDGAALMHMGAMAVIAQQKQKNLVHIVINNGCHESVGGQPTVAFSIDMEQIAKGCGYERVVTCTTKEEIKQVLKQQKLKQQKLKQQGLKQQESKQQILEQKNLLDKDDKTTWIQIMVKQGSRSDLGRPTIPAKENKENFMREIMG